MWFTLLQFGRNSPLLGSMMTEHFVQVLPLGSACCTAAALPFFLPFLPFLASAGLCSASWPTAEASAEGWTVTSSAVQTFTKRFCLSLRRAWCRLPVGPMAKAYLCIGKHIAMALCAACICCPTTHHS